ncbi:hypothetical protein VNI00_006076 [Paramarasmius palmivorus]|uniref:Secreted protein n=1 Tax=Paramarasmius palmivorus TaxID=297713 RepID=A0AAW0D909_9AGAR
MKFFVVASLAALVSAVQAQLTVNTPSNLVECQPALLTWTGGAAPYFLDGNNPSGEPLKRFPETSDTSLTWTVDLSAGTSVGLLLRDSSGAVSQSAAVSIQAGSSTNCH